MKQCSTLGCVYPVFSKGLCANHWRPIYGKPIKPVGLKQTTDGKVAKPFKVKYQTKAIKRDKSKTVDELTRKRELDSFFNEQADHVPERCENCNKKLNAFSKWAKRCVTAHILPKDPEHGFPSVATHPANKMFLGCSIFSDCQCHGNWDNLDADYRKTMPVYDRALQIAEEELYNLLSPHEQAMYEKYFGLTRLSKGV